METLVKQVRRAQRRLFFQEFLRALCWSWFGLLLAATVAIGIGKLWPLGVPDAYWAGGAVGVGLLTALVWTIARRRGALDAAIEIDRRFHLKERVSSTLALSAEELETPAGKALAADAVRRLEQLDVAEEFGVRLGRWSLLPLAPALVAFLLAVFVSPRTNTNTAEAKPDPELVQKQVKESTEALRRRLVDRRKEARERGLKDAEQLFEKLERGTKELARTDTDRKQALVNLNDLAKELEQRRQELGNGEKLKQQLNQLKDLKQGPADKLAEAMRQGDLAQAAKELEQLKEQIRQGKLDPEAQKRLAEQLEQMEQKLRQAAEAHRKQMEELQRQIAQKRAEGRQEEADQLQQQLDQLAQQSRQMQQLEQLAQKMGQCAECMKNGQSQEAAASLEQLEADLNELQRELDELQMLDEALDEIAECKACMNGRGQRDGPPGFGLGEGRGQGERPEERTDVKFHDSRVKQKTGRGAAVVTDFVEGPNVKGQVEQEIQLQFESAKGGEADPLTGQRLPREYRDHAKSYFDAFREGQRPAAPSTP